MSIHTERTFEAAIEEELFQYGEYIKGHSNDSNADHGLFPAYVFAFLQESQPKEWEKISNIHKADIELKVLNCLLKELDLRGTLDVVRNCFTDYGVKFKMAYFKPESTLNVQSQELYKIKQLTVTRQLFYERQGRNSLDMVLSMNGLPIATVELKNQFTGQNIQDAQNQYVYDREPSEPIFQLKKKSGPFCGRRRRMLHDDQAGRKKYALSSFQPWA